MANHQSKQITCTMAEFSILRMQCRAWEMRTTFLRMHWFNFEFFWYKNVTYNRNVRLLECVDFHHIFRSLFAMCNGGFGMLNSVEAIWMTRNGCWKRIKMWNWRRNSVEWEWGWWLVVKEEVWKWKLLLEGEKGVRLFCAIDSIIIRGADDFCYSFFFP